MLFQFLCLLNNNCQYPSIIRAIDQRFSAGTIPPPTQWTWGSTWRHFWYHKSGMRSLLASRGSGPGVVAERSAMHGAEWSSPRVAGAEAEKPCCGSRHLFGGPATFQDAMHQALSHGI